MGDLLCVRCRRATGDAVLIGGTDEAAFEYWRPVAPLCGQCADVVWSTQLPELRAAIEEVLR